MSAGTLLKSENAAKFLGVSKATLAKWRVYGTGPSFVKVGSRVMYCMSDIDAWIDDRRQTNTAKQ
tara:strand:- start:1571 stop:1765 length:195 start_codon:yes stop_codon:yes gene_type:complete